MALHKNGGKKDKLFNKLSDNQEHTEKKNKPLHLKKNSK